MLPKKLGRHVDQACRVFLWAGKEGLSRKGLVAWIQVCQPMLHGGLNIRQIFVWTRDALLKQLWVFSLKKDRLWVKGTCLLHKPWLPYGM